MRRVLFLLPVLLLAAFWGYQDVHARLNASLNISKKQDFEIRPGSGLQQVIAALQREGIMPADRTAPYLRGYARLYGQNTQIKAGEYELTPGMSTLDLLRLFVSGKTVLHTLRIIEGWNFQQMMKAVREHPRLEQTLGDADGEDVMSAIGRPDVHPEGRFFPDTYQFPKGTTDVAFLRRAYTAMQHMQEQEWAKRQPDLPYASPEEALIMASIVEKETGLASERALIAGVFVNRLRMGMRLQTDPTVIYGLGESFDGNLRRIDLQTDTPYNTYTRAGLPPTPICLPGRAAFRAALKPQPTRAIFFVARRDGSHQFSETLDQHNQAVREFQLGRRNGKKNK